MAAGADPAVTVKVNGGPYLVGQKIPVEITVTNLGTAMATGVKAYNEFVSGSRLGISGYGELGTPAGASIPAGEKLVVTAEGYVYSWAGQPVSRIRIYSANDSSLENNTFEWATSIVEPDSGRGSVSGLVYGDANGNGAADTGEGLAGVQINISNDLDVVRGRTGADGRFTIGDLPLRHYRVSAGDAPDGWVVRSASRNVDVDGDEYLEFGAVRPFSDQLGVSIDFTEDTYQVGQTAEMVVVLTNKGDADISGVKAGCDRSGEGPHVVDMVLGDLAWNAAGVTVPAGRSRTLTITGVVPPHAAGFASVKVACDFGPDGDPNGHPWASDVVRVPGAGPGGTFGHLYYDRDGDTIGDADEFVAGVELAAFDRITGLFAAATTTDANGRWEFTNLPAGPYELEIRGPWKFEHGTMGFYIGTCGLHCGGGVTVRILPVPVDPDPEPTTTQPTPTTTAPAGGGGGGSTTGGGLATTGASTVGLTAFGLLVLVAGVGAVTATRRRRGA